MRLLFYISNETNVLQGITGGVILAASASSYLYFTGRITGISGMLGNLISPATKNDEIWPACYFSGLLLSGFALKQHSLQYFNLDTNINPTVLILSGILVGFGTKLGNGCTSGHGLCGVARLSPRSVLATVTFISSAMISKFIVNQVFLDKFSKVFEFVRIPDLLLSKVSPFTATICSVFIARTLFSRSSLLSNDITNFKTKFSDILNYVVSFVSGFTFGLGLGVSGMTNSTRVHNFLDIFNTNGWDLTLAGVMGSGVVMNFFVFSHLSKQNKKIPLDMNNTYSSKIKFGLVKENQYIDWKLVAGSAIFGVGWSLSGICPGPGLVTVGANMHGLSYFLPSVVLGISLHNLLPYWSSIINKHFGN